MSSPQDHTSSPRGPAPTSSSSFKTSGASPASPSLFDSSISNKAVASASLILHYHLKYYKNTRVTCTWLVTHWPSAVWTLLFRSITSLKDIIWHENLRCLVYYHLQVFLIIRVFHSFNSCMFTSSCFLCISKHRVVIFLTSLLFLSHYCLLNCISNLSSPLAHRGAVTPYSLPASLLTLSTTVALV